MDVVSSEARSGLPSQLLYADLVIMAPTMEQLGKGLKVNAGKYKVMVGTSGWKMIVNSGKWPCGSLGKEYRQTLFSAQYVKKMDS